MPNAELRCKRCGRFRKENGGCKDCTSTKLWDAVDGCPGIVGVFDGKTWTTSTTNRIQITKPRPRSRIHMVIPDCQVKPGVSIEHLEWIGRYIVDKQPDVIVCIGDFADMPSLNSHEKGKRALEGQTYSADVNVVHAAMDSLLAPLRDYQKTNPAYSPRLIMTLGNHEDRIDRAVEENAKLYGTISTKDLGYEEAGWEVYPFLEVVVVDGIAYSHYFTSGVMGRPVISARALVKARHMSATMGHVQTTDIYMGDVRADGKPIIGMFVGTCYLHNEKYLTPQGNHHRRQIVMKHEVDDGNYDPMLVSLDYLRRKYAE